MIDSGVGAGIVSIITESLYDNPIVIFREYVQNSVDSIYKTEQKENREIRIWDNADNLFFLQIELWQSRIVSQCLGLKKKFFF